MRGIQKEILENLDRIEEQYQVKILHAVESGSRAWGFASPDSDYDVRFIYMHRPEEYLRIDPAKDVIEWQLDEVLDINGWDLKKAMLAYGKGNPNIMEWANSPVIYRTSEEWARLKTAVLHYFSQKAALCHYYGTAKIRSPPPALLQVDRALSQCSSRGILKADGLVRRDRPCPGQNPSVRNRRPADQEIRNGRKRSESPDSGHHRFHTE